MPKKVEITVMKVALSHLELAVHNAVKQAAVYDLTEEHRIAMRAFVKQLEPLAEVSSSGGLDDTIPISEFPISQLRIVTAATSSSGDKKDIDTADGKADGVCVALEEDRAWDEWFRKIVNRFKLWSTGSSGSIDGNSLYNKLHLLHRHPNTKIRWQSTCLRRVLIAADQDGDGSIEMADLIQLMDVRNSPAVREAVLALEFLLVESDTITIKEDAPQGKYVVLQTSKYRIAWDCLMTSFLFYISIALPYTIAFYDDNSMPSTLDTIDTVINSFFIVDLISNFFTSYKDRDDREITHLRLTALHYFRTWFFIDLVSSIPTFQAAKMLKFSKLSKVFRMLRIAKVKHLITCFEDQMDELSGSVPLTISLSGLTMLLSGVFISHWLACFMLTVTTSGFLRIYAQEVGDSDGQRYIAALYWAMTTITTVGYGDIVPGTDAERGYAMCAMVIGGSFYGYVIGSMVSLIHQVNLNQEGYAEKMENVRAWLDFYKFPKCTRLQVLRYFKRYFAQNTVIADAAIILECLPLDLQESVAEIVVHEVVRQNPLFDNIPSIFGRIAAILHQMTVDSKARIVSAGEPGRNMFIIRHGLVCLDKGAGASKCDLAASSQTTGQLKDHRAFTLVGGDSFGEEIILSVEEFYEYSVHAVSEVTMFTIAENLFVEQFSCMPEVLVQMRNNFLSYYLRWTSLMN